MRRLMGSILGVVLAATAASPASWAAEVQDVKPQPDKNGPTYLGRPLSYWMRCIRDRDPENMDLAFDAIRDLGPAAWQAVPELTRVVAEPFKPIELGVDGPSVILSKIREIHFRSDAIDGLAAIGDAAAPSAASLIRWAFAVRVIPRNLADSVVDKLYIDLVAMDVLERMRVAGAVAQFGPDAGPAVTALLQSPDGERRKLGVAVLSEGALPIAADLMKSPDCDDRQLGLAILIDMWPVVAREHLLELRNSLACQDARN